MAVSPAWGVAPAWIIWRMQKRQNSAGSEVGQIWAPECVGGRYDLRWRPRWEQSCIAGSGEKYKLTVWGGTLVRDGWSGSGDENMQDCVWRRTRRWRWSTTWPVRRTIKSQGTGWKMIDSHQKEDPEELNVLGQTSTALFFLVFWVSSSSGFYFYSGQDIF